MRYSYVFMAVACSLATVQAQAASQSDSQLPQVSLLQTTTEASNSAPVIEMQQQVQQYLQKALLGTAPKLTRAVLDKAPDQGEPQGDMKWLKATGYVFNPKDQQQASVKLLEGFRTLPAPVLQKNLATVERINLESTLPLRQKALIDAENTRYLYALAEALGPKLGKAFLDVYQKGEIGKAAALIKATNVSTSAAKNAFNYPRPFKQPGNNIHLVPDTAVVADNARYTASGGSFPSGHTNGGYNDALLLAQMLPERFVPLIDRAASYGYSRLVLGVHYPLDVIGGRMAAERSVAHFLNDPKYRVLFNDAKTQLRAALEKACGTTLAECAKPQGKNDPYTDPAMKSFYRYTMTYNLPSAKVKAQPVKVPEGAEVLLEGPLPQLSAAQRRALMVKTAIADGYPLSAGGVDANFWQRLNLHDAVEAAKTVTK
ncbi:acid phosphatase [Dickeya fangzhongdai]|uniref:Phosphatase PAP2 family protein n=1 Tax=Dickeya fangzhongdai TaxID=1778540 RepID=A0A2K8QKX0_9GAMM|nr:phosphatase PAP2 family protein [Dickeya fangzhongdai]ATZ94134.1 phosphatase PAP2 family protein [Dickeya fangzhongdai]QOH47569.1 phosphatase PAP2 family protein [Dickeya fangzhongdai]QOH51875.1 phosphatase PAP2 family protein [Dickeya fangzhongdai]WOY00929.1 phosphatase PAP2 family protein [Dickeya fangzhongdai]WOY03919.1 phosphatase PAP2 family protein [Dickeya fangzhongdai]